MIKDLYTHVWKRGFDFKYRGNVAGVAPNGLMVAFLLYFAGPVWHPRDAAGWVFNVIVSLIILCYARAVYLRARDWAFIRNLRKQRGSFLPRTYEPTDEEVLDEIYYNR